MHGNRTNKLNFFTIFRWFAYRFCVMPFVSYVLVVTYSIRSTFFHHVSFKHREVFCDIPRGKRVHCTTINIHIRRAPLQYALSSASIFFVINFLCNTAYENSIIENIEINSCASICPIKFKKQIFNNLMKKCKEKISCWSSIMQYTCSECIIWSTMISMTHEQMYTFVLHRYLQIDSI